MPSLKSIWNPFIKTERPNIRKMFKPDPGYILFEVDLKQADAQVVAWEAQALKLMTIFEEINAGADRDIHKENALVCFNTNTVSPWQRQISKHVVHGTNFCGSSYTIAHHLALLKSQVDVFQKRWFITHPEIKRWHQSTENELMQTRTVRNIFGYQRMFFDRIETILPEAVAWKAQSTTALVINAGIRTARRDVPEAQMLMQVHDSALGQVPVVSWNAALKQRLRKAFTVRLPYPRPLEMLVELKTSEKSWGDAEKEKWE